MLVTIKSNQACLNAPFGSILLTFEGDELVRCELSEEAVEEDLGSFAEHKAVKALKSYLGGSVQALDNWKSSEDGTEFRCQVWKEIAKVKAGDTVTYGQIADNLNSSPRAVGSACGDNPLPIFVGCPSCCRKEQFGRIRAFRRQSLNKMLASQARTAKHVRSLNE